MNKRTYSLFNKGAAIVCGIYLLLGVTWIVYSGLGLNFLKRILPNESPEHFLFIEKVGTMLVTAIILYCMVWWFNHRTWFFNQQLLESREEVFILFDKAPVGIAKVGLDGKYIKVNRQLCMLLGYNEEELCGRTFGDITHKDDINRDMENFHRLIKGEQDYYSAEKRYIRNNGLPIWVEVNVNNAYDPNGNPRYFITVVTDISQRKEAERTFLDNNRYYQAILENSFEGIALLDRDGRVNYQTPSAEKITGYSFEAQKGKVIFNLVPDEDKPNSRKLFEGLLAEPSKQEFATTRIVHKDGTLRVVEIFAKNMFDDPMVKAMVLNFHDVTEQKKAEKKIFSSIIEGEDRERQRIASELHDGLGQQLTAASLNLEGMKDAVEKLQYDKQQQFQLGLTFLNKAIDESRNIAHNLMPMSIEDFGLIFSIESLFASIRKTTDLDITFLHNIGKERFGSQVETNLYRITQEALNNVIKHAQARHVTVQLVRHPDSLIFTFEDDGIGFDNSDKSYRKTAGMGLTNILNRVKSISGQLSIDSKPGYGTAVTIELKV